MLKVYQYKNCGTCRKALKFLDANNIEYKTIAVRETPPSKTELKKMLKFLDGEIKKMFNTSSKDYRENNIKEKLATLSKDDALDLLTQNGNLVKRPFVLSKNDGWVGFKEEIWQEKIGNL